jgi:hypothetical protein
MPQDARCDPDAERHALHTARRIVKEFEELNDWVRATKNGEIGRLAVGFYTTDVRSTSTPAAHFLI